MKLTPFALAFFLLLSPFFFILLLVFPSNFLFYLLLLCSLLLLVLPLFFLRFLFLFCLSLRPSLPSFVLCCMDPHLFPRFVPSSMIADWQTRHFGFDLYTSRTIAKVNIFDEASTPPSLASVMVCSMSSICFSFARLLLLSTFAEMLLI